MGTVFVAGSQSRSGDDGFTYLHRREASFLDNEYLAPISDRPQAAWGDTPPEIGHFGQSGKQQASQDIAGCQFT